MSHKKLSNPLRVRLLRLVAGYTICAFGLMFLLHERIGVDPYDVLVTGVARSIHQSVGLASFLTALAFIIFSFLLGKRAGWGTLLGMVLISGIINTTMPLLPHSQGLGIDLLYWCLGTAAIAFGAALVVMTQLGPGAPELLMLALVNKGFPLRIMRIGLDFLFALGGFLLGGALGVGTGLFVVSFGPLLAFFLHRLGFPAAKVKSVLPLQSEVALILPLTEDKK